MKMPPFPHSLEKFSDYDLGGFLLGYYIAAQAVELGIDPDNLPEGFSELVIEKILNEDNRNPKIISLEKALRKAALGDFKAAGEIFREDFKTSAVTKAALDEAVTGKRRQKRIAQKDRTSNLNK